MLYTAVLVICGCTNAPSRQPLEYLGIQQHEYSNKHVFCDTVDRGLYPVCNQLTVKTPADNFNIDDLLKNEPAAIVNFDFNKSILKPEAKNILDAVIQNPKYQGKILYLKGYTDNIGGEKYNNILAQKRADSVKSYLSMKGLPNEMMVSLGFGLCCYVVENNTDSNREKNRRVEIYIDTKN
ncbi:OmpA family protein (plasmid) [Acinetobacter baumannii]|uniref:OmpA family protein n=1 Tax=Acinetobacter baumannii TaxID=470 RepID=UPI0016615B2D|nr:OmpA family protein [Acinetobacter baumannii]EKV6896358.1 OmpA family protein [Acinetobacter baumannii]MBD0502967.1 OmpA family protein [Acinetobacter baumannii]MCW8631779.1 OmpA family protein [Acinetobacter baumannii]MCW8642888.1 OmpA family protein [Acinetobacter baumannii]MDO7359576.1 OmpA family protein [Acinetobacter baumannii]